MTYPILYIHRRYTNALPIDHHQVQHKPLKKQLHTLLETLSTYCFPCSIRRTRRPIRLSSFAILQALPTKRSSVYHPFTRRIKRHAIVIEPVVFRHLAERGLDATLSCGCFRYVCGFESGFCKAYGGS
jgi:hypothetical protein